MDMARHGHCACGYGMEMITCAADTRDSAPRITSQTSQLTHGVACAIRSQYSMPRGDLARGESSRGDLARGDRAPGLFVLGQKALFAVATATSTVAADLLCGVKPRGESPRWLFASFRWLLSPRGVPLRGVLGSPLTGFAFGAMRSVHSHRKAGSARRTRGLLREVYSSIFNRLPGYSYSCKLDDFGSTQKHHDR